MNIEPLYCNMLVKVIDYAEIEKSQSKIVVPHNMHRNMLCCEIMKKGIDVLTNFQIGDIVIIPSSLYEECLMDIDNSSTVDTLIITDTDVLAMVRE